MKRLWAPWRYEYVSNDHKETSCFLCHAARLDTAEFAEHLVLERTAHALAVINRYPYNTGHLLVAPLRHIGQPEEFSEQEVADVWRLVCQFKRRLDATCRPDGFNLGINLGESAGAGLPEHAHVHIVPRWTGDTNFMSVVADTKVMPESLEDVYRKLAGGKDGC